MKKKKKKKSTRKKINYVRSIQEISIRDLRGPKKEMKTLKNKRRIWKPSCWKYKETL